MDVAQAGEKEKMIDFDARMMEVISVDDFDPKELVSKTKNSIEEN